jgi:hypothetical protein
MKNERNKFHFSCQLIICLLLTICVFTSARPPSQSGYSIESLEQTLKRFVTPKVAAKNARRQSKQIEQESNSVAAQKIEGDSIQRVAKSVIERVSILTPLNKQSGYDSIVDSVQNLFQPQAVSAPEKEKSKKQKRIHHRHGRHQHYQNNLADYSP